MQLLKKKLIVIFEKNHVWSRTHIPRVESDQVTVQWINKGPSNEK